MIVIHGRASSSNVQAVMWLVAELGLDHERIDAGGSFGGLDTPEFLARNPNGTIPVLEDDGLTLWESNAILRYLAARYGSKELWPADPLARAPVDQWLEWAKATVNPAFVNGLFWSLWRTPPDERDATAIARHLAGSNRLMGIADGHLEGRPWLAGDHFTLADVGLGTLLFRYFTLPIERPELPSLSRYYVALTERPAYAANVMVDYASLAGVSR